MTSVKPFQEATVEAVLRAFRAGRRYRRFLVADEVGLGKTVVAQQVIRRMMRGRSKPVVVFYLCSNLSIAAQNRRKLLEVLPPEERRTATSHVDRLTLLPTSDDQPEHPTLRLFSLTPDTSLPMRKGRRRDGRQDERALIHALVERTCPWLFEMYRRRVFKRNAHRYWGSYYIPRARKLARNTALQNAFRMSVRQEFGLAEGEHVDAAVRGRELDELALIAHLRNALAASAIEQLKPDLVIFDEFQRFRDLLVPEQDEAAQRVIGRLRGEDTKNPPALLLLSATPYRLYSRRAEEASSNSHRAEFFELVEFLYGGTPQAKERRQTCESAFATIEAELRKGTPGSDAARQAKVRAEALLRKVMVRTERSSHPIGLEEERTDALPAPVTAEDLIIFKHTSRSFSESHRDSAVPYWTSIPLPMQTMGSHYVAWKAAKNVPIDGVPRLDEAMRDEYKYPIPWPHPRLRALQELFPPDTAVTPWLAPSNPWWELGGAWKRERTRPSKALIFSRFRAVPQAVASTLSFDLEARHLCRDRIAYPEVTKRRLLSATEGRHALLALFHPSPLIVTATEPLAADERTRAGVRKHLQHQLRHVLRDLDVGIGSRGPHLPMWKLIARLEARAGHWPYVRRGWKRMNATLIRAETSDGGLTQLLSDWDEEAGMAIDSIRPSALDVLVNHALSAPGVVIGRALYRHWNEAVGEHGYAHALEAAWSGLRNYLDQRWFFAALRRRKETYPDVIRRAIIEGNLESVLDEHLWITSQLRSLREQQLANELRDGLSIKTGLFFLHPPGQKDGTTFSLRCHVAMPFVEGRAAYAHETGATENTEAPRIRTDELRKAFNTPFWPYVLATTSVGQEGLDFHAWCDTIVHWDLCRNPVDLEQREGRIQRYGGLSIRRAIVRALGADIRSEREAGESPWATIQRLAEERLADESGLVPWWVCPGGSIRRYVFEVPTSEQRHWLQWVQEQRLFYRLALGQPNQEDLVEFLAKIKGIDPKTVRDTAINLSPWFGDRGRA